MIGYLGSEGSYTFHAAATFYVHEELIPYNNIGKLFHALDTNEVDGICLPYENMRDGTSFDVLGRVRKKHYHISREIILNIILNVVSMEHNADQIEKLFATDLTINESYNTLKKEFGKYQKMLVKSNKQAIHNVSLPSKSVQGAVVSSYDELGDLNVVLSDVRDSHENTHRYVLVTKSLKVNGFHNRTLIACSPKQNRVGALYDILHEFVLRRINLVKILSHPLKSKEDDIIFYLEVEGNIEDALIIEALGIVKFKSKFVSILGSYYSK